LKFVPAYAHDLQAGKDRLENLSPSVIMTENGPIEYVRRGSGPPLLISHGITGGFDQGLSLADTYVGDGYEIIAVSRFGYLGSAMPGDGRPKTQADAYRSLIDTLDVEKGYRVR
jgi:pimeloyl-ACP methyl ester carboxylesterase